MYKRILFMGFLALPGAFIVVSLACIHPRCRAVLAELVYAPGLLSRIKERFAI
jgi:hypothetical protein